MARPTVINGTWDEEFVPEAVALPSQQPVAQPARKPGIVSDVRRGLGGAVSTIGRSLEDTGIGRGVGLRLGDLGDNISGDTQSEIQSVGDIIRKPVTAVREAIGETAGQIPVILGSGVAGRVAGGGIGAGIAIAAGQAGPQAALPEEALTVPAAVSLGQAIGARVGAAAPVFGMTYGSIRERQDENGTSSKALALAGATAATALELIVGPERYAAILAGKGLIKKGGDTLIKTAAREAVGEGATEVGQTIIERGAAGESLADADALNEYGVAGFKGAAGGAVVGTGLRAITPGERPQRTQRDVEAPVVPDQVDPTEPADLLQLPSPEAVRSQPRPSGPTILVDPEGQASTTGNFASEAMTTAPRGSQGDLFGRPTPPPLTDLLGADFEAGRRPSQPQPADPNQPSLFDAAPEAEAVSRVASDYKLENVLLQLRSANANDDGTLGRADSFTVSLANKLSAALTRGDLPSAQELISAEFDKLETANVSGKTVDSRLRTLEAAAQTVLGFQQSLTREYAEAARSRPAQPGARVTLDPASPQSQAVEQAVEQNFQRNEFEQQAALNQRIEQEQAAMQAQQQELLEGQRQDAEKINAAREERAVSEARASVLDNILNDAETRNPTARFVAELRRRNLDVDIKSDEAARIARFEEARDAFTRPDEIESGPDESGNFGIRERGQPKPSNRDERRRGREMARPASQKQPPAPTPRLDPTTRTRNRAKLRADEMGSTRGRWFMHGADAELGIGDRTPVGPTQSRAFEQGRAYARQELAVQEAEAGAARTAAPAQPVEPAQPDPPSTVAGRRVLTNAEVRERLLNRNRQKADYSDFLERLEEARDAREIDNRTYTQFQKLASDGNLSPKELDDRLDFVLQGDPDAGLDQEVDAEEASPEPARPVRRQATGRPRVRDKGPAGPQNPKTPGLARRAAVGGIRPEDVPIDLKGTWVKLRRELDAIGLKDVTLDFTDAFGLTDPGLPGVVRGMYYPEEKLMRLAYGFDDVAVTLDHEIIHALKDAGVFTDGEWWMLVDQASKIPEITRWVNTYYADQPRSMQQEESVAEMFALWRKYTAPPNKFARIWQKVKAFFAAIKRVFVAEGYKTAEDVMAAISTGEIGRRSRPMSRAEIYRYMQETRSPADAPRPRLGPPPAERLPEPLREPASVVATNAAEFGKKGLLFSAFTRDVADMAAKVLPAAQKVVDLQLSNHAVSRMYEQRLGDIKRMYEKLPNTLKGDGVRTVNKFLFDSTTSGKWGYIPAYLQGKVQVDADMERQFKALPAEAQDVVKAVFRFGYDSLREMKASVTAAIDADYADLIADTTDPDEIAEYTKRRDAALQRYETLMGVSELQPYAPKRREGNYVVVGMSREFAEAKKARDTKTMKDLEGDANHYYVDFAESAGQAARLAKQLGSRYEITQHFEKDRAADELNGQEMFLAFERLQKLIEREGGDDSARRKLRRMTTELYLSVLAETSARKAELNRRNVAAGDLDIGGSLDMMRAFVTRGQATAHFIAAMHNNGQMLDAIAEMQSEAFDPLATNRDDRMRFYNEIMNRYTASLARRNSRMADVITRATSVMFLTLSPSYHAQNLLQPALFSLPYMSGRLGYGKSVKLLQQAYNDIAPIVSEAGVSERLDLTGVPDDVRAAVHELEGRGIIDTGMALELGSWEVNGNGAIATRWNAIDRVLRLLPQNVETLNRAATAIAAYRGARQQGMGDKAAIDYAEEVIFNTHGDYSGFNAPRLLGGSSEIGRVIFQFKKFPLILTSLMARLVHNSFKGATAEDRLMARKSLGFVLGHAAVVGGALGMPGASVIGFIIEKVFNAFGDDDPDDPELALRRLLGDDTLADLLIKGAPYAFLNIDTSQKLGMGQMLDILPFVDTDNALADRSGYNEFVVASLGPFIGGVMPKMVDALGRLAEGDYYRALEQAMPAGPSHMMRAARIGDEGLTRRNGDVVMSAADIDFLDQASVLMGFPSKTLADQTWKSRVLYETDQFFSARTTRLKRKYARAVREGDTEAAAEVREDWRQLQEAKRRNGYRPSPMTELLRAPAERTRREARTAGGAPFRPQNRQFVQELDEMTN